MLRSGRYSPFWAQHGTLCVSTEGAPHDCSDTALSSDKIRPHEIQHRCPLHHAQAPAMPITAGQHRRAGSVRACVQLSQPALGSKPHEDTPYAVPAAQCCAAQRKTPCCGQLRASRSKAGSGRKVQSARARHDSKPKQQRASRGKQVADNNIEYLNSAQQGEARCKRAKPHTTRRGRGSMRAGIAAGYQAGEDEDAAAGPPERA